MYNTKKTGHKIRTRHTWRTPMEYPADHG